VDVDRVPAAPRLIEAAGQEAGRVVARLLVRVDEESDLPTTIVRAVVRVCGQERDDTEVVAGRVAQLLRQDERDLRRPENWLST